MVVRSSVITRKGQVTIPAEIRAELGLREGDRVEFVVKNKTVSLIPRGSFVARTAGIVRSRGKPLSAEELREAAANAIADDVEKRLRESAADLPRH